MPARPFFPALCASLAAGWLVVAAPAQETDDLNALVPESLAAMKAEQWEQALKSLTRATALKPAAALRTYGPQFGVVWYRRGVCEMKLRRWDEALHSFEVCYRDYPNRGPAGGNLFQTKALLKWGEAAVGAGKWEVAIQRFRKFLDERDKARDTFPQGAFYVTYAICHYKLGHLPEGSEQLEIAIRNRSGFPTSDDQIVAGIQALAGAAITAKNERALLDFLASNRSELALEPFRAHRYAPVYLKLATEAAAAGMNRAALVLYQSVTDPLVAIDDLNARIQSLGSRPGVPDGAGILDKAELEADLRRLEQDREGETPLGLLKLVGLAGLQESLGNVRAAFVLRERMLLDFPRQAGSEELLYQLVRACTLVSAATKLDEYGIRFLADFPKSGHAPEVRRWLLVPWFAAGENDRCIEKISPLIGSLAPGSPDHDLCLYLLGGAYARKGEAAKAQPLLDEHASRYPASPFAESVLFFQASNATRLGEWEKAAGLLDAFLKRFPDPSKSAYVPRVLLDRARCQSGRGDAAGAVPFLDQVLSYPGLEPAVELEARLGRGDARSRSTTADGLDRAVEDFERVRELAGKSDLGELAALRIVECLMAKKDFSAAQARATLLLESAVNRAPQLRFLQAQAFEGSEKIDEAIAAYAGLWADDKAPPTVSLQALKHWMELLWERNLPAGDRVAACKGARAYLDATQATAERLSEADLAVRKEIEQLLKTFQQDPSLQPTPSP